MKMNTVLGIQVGIFESTRFTNIDKQMYGLCSRPCIPLPTGSHIQNVVFSFEKNPREATAEIYTPTGDDILLVYNEDTQSSYIQRPSSTLPEGCFLVLIHTSTGEIYVTSKIDQGVLVSILQDYIQQQIPTYDSGEQA